MRWPRRTSPGTDAPANPSFQPPGAVFPIVWTALYAKIAWASARTIDRLDDADRHDEARRFEQALGANLALNAG